MTSKFWAFQYNILWLNYYSLIFPYIKTAEILYYYTLIIYSSSLMSHSHCKIKHTWLEGPGEAKGEGHGPSCNEKCAINTISFAKAPLTSALGHSNRYSEKRFETLKRTLCANQKRTFLLWRRRMHRASYLKKNFKLMVSCFMVKDWCTKGGSQS